MIHNETLEVARSAEALHWAVRELRENTKGDSGKVEETDPVIWASYIHSGAWSHSRRSFSRQIESVPVCSDEAGSELGKGWKRREENVCIAYVS